MKHVLLVSLVLCGFSVARAQEAAPVPAPSPWKHSLKTGLTFAQASFSPNWKGGGVNSLALNSFFFLKNNYQVEKWNFASDLQLQYGIQEVAGQSRRKTQDVVYYDAKGGYRLDSSWNVFFGVNLLTQFTNGYKYDKVAGVETETYVSNFFAPGYISQAIGLEYKPVPWFYVRLGALAFRQTIVRDTTLYRTVPNNYGVNRGDQVRNEPVAQVIAGFDKTVWKNIGIKANYLSFIPYQDPGLDQIYHRLDVSLTASVNKFVTCSIGTIGIYDIRADKDIQLAQNLGIGVNILLEK